MAQVFEAAPASSGRRGFRAALVTFLIVAYPLLWTASLTHAAFSGCWLSCGGKPSPAFGIAWGMVGGVLLGAPLAVGLRTAKVRSRAAWVAGVLVVLLVVAAWAVFSLDPGHAEFFVELGEQSAPGVLPSVQQARGGPMVPSRAAPWSGGGTPAGCR